MLAGLVSDAVAIEIVRSVSCALLRDEFRDPIQKIRLRVGDSERLKYTYTVLFSDLRF